MPRSWGWSPPRLRTRPIAIRSRWSARALYPGDLAMEERLTAIMRWNALAMVMRANKAYGELGGHIASYASAAEIFEVGFNHFFRAAMPTRRRRPGLFPAAFGARRVCARVSGGPAERGSAAALPPGSLGGNGLCSYPHPWLMPEFWQFPTGSMGIGPINVDLPGALHALPGSPRAGRRPRPAASGACLATARWMSPNRSARLTLAAREQLDNLTFIINCNLQRLDGPVRGNGQIIQELEALFTRRRLERHQGAVGIGLGRAVRARQARTRCCGASPRPSTANIRRSAPTTAPTTRRTSSSSIRSCRRWSRTCRGARSTRCARRPRRAQAVRRASRPRARTAASPTVILAKTKKGYGMGGAGESRMTAHQQKKLDLEALRAFRDRFDLPLSDEQVARAALLSGRPTTAANCVSARSAARRSAAICRRRRSVRRAIAVPALDSYAKLRAGGGRQGDVHHHGGGAHVQQSAAGRSVGPRIVPIVADEARTFGMANLFRQVGIYSPVGQLYEPEDAGSMLSYREARDGQLLEEGITEAGALSSWIAAAHLLQRARRAPCCRSTSSIRCSVSSASAI